MKYITKTILTVLASLSIPLLAFASISVGWNATSTDHGFITPNTVNGFIGAIKVPYLAATSTTESTLFGGLSVYNVPSTTPEIGINGGADTYPRLTVGPSLMGGSTINGIGLGNTILNANSRNVLVIVSHGPNSLLALPGVGTVQSRGTAAAPTATQSGDDIYFMGARGYGTTDYSNGSKAVISFNASQNWTDSAQGTYITLETTPNNSTFRTEAMRVNQNGNVGIGTTSPWRTLSVSGSSDLGTNALVGTLTATTICLTGDICRSTWPTGALYPFTPATNYGVLNQATTGIVWFQNGLNASTTSHFVNASTTLLTTAGSSYVAQSAGNLYVGGQTSYNTQGAGEKTISCEFSNGCALELVRNAGAGVGGGEVSWVNSGNTAGNQGIAYIQAITTGGTNGGAVLQFATKQDAFAGIAQERMRISDSGNVGINVTNPNSKLSVDSSDGVTNPFEATVLGTDVVRVDPTGQINLTGGPNGTNVYLSNSVALATNNTPVLFWQAYNENSVYQGLRDTATTGCGNSGDNNGLFKYQVVNTNNTVAYYSPFSIQTGGTSFPTTKPLFGPTAGDASCLVLGIGATGGDVTDALTFYTNSTQRGQFSSTGNFGIGTTSPYAKLSVVGEAVARNFTATSTTATSTFSGNMSLSGKLADSLNAVGTNGQVLTSIGTATKWQSAAAASVATSTASFRNQTATISSVNTYTPTASSTYSVVISASVKTISAGTLTITCTYTNVDGVASTATFFPMGLTSAGLTGTGSASFSPLSITPMKNTAVTAVATFTGVSVTYDIDASILPIGTTVN